MTGGAMKAKIVRVKIEEDTGLYVATSKGPTGFASREAHAGSARRRYPASCR